MHPGRSFPIDQMKSMEFLSHLVLVVLMSRVFDGPYMYAPQLQFRQGDKYVMKATTPCITVAEYEVLGF